MTTTAIRVYPKHAKIGKDEASITLRPLQSGDEHELLEFFRRVPEEDRFYLKEDVTLAEVIHRWVEHIDYNRVFALVAVANGAIVGDATLHRSRSNARSHAGEIRVVVDPNFRNQGLGTMLLRELVDIATDSGLDSILFELVEEKEEDAIKVSERLGFTKVATIPNNVRDIDGRFHNSIVMQHNLGDWMEW
jgi:L-amino acid N-acyltransferase YncA